MKYHLTENGEVTKCKAIFRKCPYGEHFNSFEEGLHYIEELEENKSIYSKLTNEDILLPGKDLLDEVKNFKDKSFFDTVDVTDDSVAIIVNDKVNGRAIDNYLVDKIRTGYIPVNSIGKAADNAHVSSMIMANFDKGYANIGLGLPDKEQEDSASYQHEQAVRVVDKLKEVGYSPTEMMRSLNYEVSDVLVDRNTKLRVFTPKKALEYIFNEGG